MSQNDSFLRLANKPMRCVREIPLYEFSSIPITERPLLVDVRGEDEWSDGHAEGAVHLSYGPVEARIREIVPDRTTPVVCYCEHGADAVFIAESLVKLGYTHVGFLAGGFRAWLIANNPVQAACR